MCTGSDIQVGSSEMEAVPAAIVGIVSLKIHPGDGNETGPDKSFGGDSHPSWFPRITWIA